MDEEQQNEIVYPSIVVEVDQNLFSVDSRYISNIMKLPEYKPLPDAPPEVMGIFKYRDTAITMFDLRAMLKMRTMESEFSEFSQMIDERKKDHIRWVDTLEKTSKTGEPFPLATDPHKCALGIWCDNFHSDISEVNFHLKKIVEPHTKLHECAVQIENLWKNQTNESQREMNVKKVFLRAQKDYMPRVLMLLEEMKQIFHNAVFQKMALVLSSQRNVCIIVDKVLSVEDLSWVTNGDNVNIFLHSPYVTEVQRSEKIPGLILGLNIPLLFENVDVSQYLKDEPVL